MVNDVVKRKRVVCVVLMIFGTLYFLLFSGEHSNIKVSFLGTTRTTENISKRRSNGIINSNDDDDDGGGGGNRDKKMRELKRIMDKALDLPYKEHKRSYRRESKLLTESSLHVFPQPSSESPYRKLLPDPTDPVNDRIYEQLHYVPKEYSNKINNRIKTIYLHGGKNQWFIEEGRDFFFTTGCKVNHCSFTYNREEGRTADIVVFGNPYQLPFRPPWPRKSPQQIWMMSALETPPHTTSMRKYIGHFNWTMSYRTDSIIVSPYFKYEAFPEKKVLPPKNHAVGKKKKVAWFVTNCFNVESGRREYARELQKYIDIDIYGGCGTKKCKKSDWEKCRQMVQRHYKFYLAFENSKCKDYLTEKVQTGLLYDAIPIVLGAATWEYANALPAHSYIDVEDFKSPKHLAEYLLQLDQNDDLFNEYFRWKSYGTFVETKPWCRVCSMIHDDSFPAIWYDNVDSWWHAKSACIKKDTHWWYNVAD